MGKKRQNCHLNLISGAYQRSVAISGEKKNRTKKVSQKKNAQPEWYRSAKLAPSPLILFFIDRAVPLWSPL